MITDNYNCILDLGNYFPGSYKRLTYNLFTFNGGEPHFSLETSAKWRLNEYRGTILITCRATSFNELGNLLVAVDGIRRMNVKYDLFIPYFPGARQDRVSNTSEPLTVKVYADIINSLNAERVLVADPHSDVVAALVNNIVILPQYYFLSQYIKAAEIKNPYLVAPDAGAEKKTYAAAKSLGISDVITCSKIRDTATGEIERLNIHLPESLNIFRPILISDDICDGGATFISLAKRLRELNITNNLYLFVTHGIFSKGTEELFQYYTGIGCTDSFSNLDGRVNIVSLERTVL